MLFQKVRSVVARYLTFLQKKEFDGTTRLKKITTNSCLYSPIEDVDRSNPPRGDEDIDETHYISQDKNIRTEFKKLRRSPSCEDKARDKIENSHSVTKSPPQKIQARKTVYSR